MFDAISVTQHLIKRVQDQQPEQGQPLPKSAFIFIFVDIIIFFPIFLFIYYTVKQIYPVLAIIEDENPPPAYNPVRLEDEEATGTSPSDPNVPEGSGSVTSSLRKTHRLLNSSPVGWRANFRGFWCLIAQGLALSVLYGIFSGILPSLIAPIATLLATLTLVQLSTAWTHIVITESRSAHFWQRLPPFNKTFKATALPTTLFFLALEITRWTPLVLAVIFRIDIPDMVNKPIHGATDHNWNPKDKSNYALVALWLISLLLYAVLVLPARIILTRVQASLLPPEEETIVAFDRSFGGRVEPAVVGGKGYATIKDAWVSMKISDWKRILLLSLKIWVIEMLFVIAMVAVLVPEILFLGIFEDKNGKGGELKI